MGLLDDAIREHLDLKRRRGADPNEIERLEREALGPVRRGAHESHGVLLEEEIAPGASYQEDAAVDDWEEPSADTALFDHAPAPEFEPETALQHRPSPELPPEPEITREREYDPPRHHEIAEEWEAHQRQPLHDERAGHGPDAPAPATPEFPTTDPRDAGPRTPAPSLDPAEQMEETAEFDVERDVGAGHADEDVLEETPEFLQETPDHDRLWFEQRPPRDFDFDG